MYPDTRYTTRAVGPSKDVNVHMYMHMLIAITVMAYNTIPSHGTVFRADVS